MYKAPELPVAPRIEVSFPDKLVDLWLKALDRPEADVKCKAADAIMIAHQRGVKGLERTIAPLQAALDRADQHPTVRLAVARTLIALESKDAAANLLQQARTGNQQMRDLVEPALSRWKYEPAYTFWMERLRDPATLPRGLIRTMQYLGAAREVRSSDRLLEIVRSEQSHAVRLEAARALGQIKTEGLEKDAEGLAASKSIPLRLAASALLLRHQSNEAVAILQRLTQDAEPAVIAPAAARLVELDPGTLVPCLHKLLASPDAKVRSQAVRVLALRPTDANLQLLADRLDDLHADVRRESRHFMKELAAKLDLRNRVIEQAMRMLKTGEWRALEQATILLTQLDHKPAAARLVELLPHERGEVFLTAAWGLRKLAVPESLPGVVRYINAEESAHSREGELFTLTDHQLSQLHQLLGQQKYRLADSALRRYVPRRANETWQEARASAIWALGMIYEGKQPAGVVNILEARLNDTMQLPVEDDRVRRMAAVSLGRMLAKSALPSLEKNSFDRQPPTDSVQTACQWALEQLTGEKPVPPKVIQRVDRDWFLVPNE
jgi:HEAT repeat protein